MGKKSRQKQERREEQAQGYKKSNNNKKNRNVTENTVAVVCKNIIWAAAALAMLTPLMYSDKLYFPFVSWKTIWFMGLAQIIFFAWLVLIMHEPKYRPKKNVVLVGVLLFLLAFTLATFFGVDVERSFWSKYERMTGLLVMLHLSGFFIALSSTLRTKKDWERLFGISLGVSMVIAIISIAESLEWIAREDWTSARGGATIGNTSFAGIYMVFNAYPALYFLITSAKENIGRKIYFASGFLLVAAALLAGSARAAAVSFFAGLGLMALLWLALEAKKRALRWTGIAGLVSGVVALAGAGVMLFQQGSIVHNWWLRLSGGARLVVWESAWKGFLDKPIFGWGPENFEMPFYKYYHPCLGIPGKCGGSVWFDRAHNVVMDTIVMMGSVGLVAYAILMGAVVFVLWKRYVKDKNIGFWMPAIFSILLVIYFIQNLTVFDMINSYMMLFLVFAFVAAMTPSKSDKEEPRGAYGVKLWPIVGIAVIFTFTFVQFVIQPYKANALTINAYRSPVGSEQRLELTRQALETSPAGRYQTREFLGSGTLQQIQQLQQQGQLQRVGAENIQRELDFMIDSANEGLEKNPDDIKFHILVARLQMAYASFDPERLDRAEEAARNVTEISPTNQQGYWELAQALSQKGEHEEALEVYEFAVELEPEMLRAHQFLLNFTSNVMEDEELTRQKAEEAMEILETGGSYLKEEEWENALSSYLR